MGEGRTKYTPINQLPPDYFYSIGKLHLREMFLGIISDAIAHHIFRIKAVSECIDMLSIARSMYEHTAF
jgi:hypothetical protein